jgi:hypothetical protein
MPRGLYCGTSGNADCGRSNRRSCDGRSGRIVRRGHRALRCGRPRSPSALFFVERRANLQTSRDKLDRGCGKCLPAPARAPSWSGNRVGIGQSIQRDDGRTYRQVGNVQIPGRSLQVTMPHQNLDAAQICRLFQQISRLVISRCARCARERAGSFNASSSSVFRAALIPYPAQICKLWNTGVRSSKTGSADELCSEINPGSINISCTTNYKTHISCLMCYTR